MTFQFKKAFVEGRKIYQQHQQQQPEAPNEKKAISQVSYKNVIKWIYVKQ